MLKLFMRARSALTTSRVNPCGWEVFEDSARVAMWVLVAIVYTTRDYL